MLLQPKGEYASVNSVLYNAGAAITFNGWPGCKLEPIDDAAKAISGYALKNQFNPHKPTTPVDAAITHRQRPSPWPSPDAYGKDEPASEPR
jgi:hypothetical protein